MSLWVKICANTSLEDAQMAADAGADAVGFVFAPSPRRVTKDQVAAIVPGLPADVEKIGVFVESTLDEIGSTVHATGLTGVQLHSDISMSETKALREIFGPRLRILRVVHFGFGADATSAANVIDSDPNVDAILVDSRTTTAVGGTGVRFDWTTAADDLFRNAQLHKRLVAAGGLDPENVAEAIATMKPWGVDVASGVEASPGRKDPAKVKAFVTHARHLRD